MKSALGKVLQASAIARTETLKWEEEMECFHHFLRRWVGGCLQGPYLGTGCGTGAFPWVKRSQTDFGVITEDKFSVPDNNPVWYLVEKLSVSECLCRRQVLFHRRLFCIFVKRIKGKLTENEAFPIVGIQFLNRRR